MSEDITGMIESGKTGEYGIRLDTFPPGTRVIVRVEYHAALLSAALEAVDGRRVTAFITDSPDHPQDLDLRHRGRGRCEQRIKDTKDLGFLAVPHHSYAANRIWMHAVILAGALSTWARLLGADPALLTDAKATATALRRDGHRAAGLDVRQARRSARSWW